MKLLNNSMNEPCLGCAYAARNQERRRKAACRRLPLSVPSTPSLREACLRHLRERQREVSPTGEEKK
ncbi:hypothetical protein FD723_07445 [Nostoc sp. C052]|uniref:hypothetical protein n=1 Tax=Nostoc sp. C052 TaxID=2576902 RepID=UPI0015C3B420|nr:hypothetical protein [Nostoc sp. C052]QLE40304.1 hypothetical protein FD723_07445 [Nostoc sp. C052]